MKIFVTCFFLIVSLIASKAIDPLMFSLNVDDRDEPPSFLLLSSIPSNPSLFSSISINNILTNGTSRQINFFIQKYGNSQVSVSLIDSGYSSIRTEIVSANSPTNTDGNLVVIRNNNSATLTWNYAPNKFGYKVNRYLTNYYDPSKISTLDIVTTNSFTDNTLLSGVNYWYDVCWLDPVLAPTTPKSTNFVFEIRSRNPVKLYNFEDGFGFVARSNVNYLVLYKTNISEPVWTVYQDIPMIIGESKLYRDTNGFYRNKIFYVREKE